MKVDIDIDHNAVRYPAKFELLRDLEHVLCVATGRVATGDDRISLIDLGDNVIIDYNDGVAQIANLEDRSPLEMAENILHTALHGKLFEFVHEEEGDRHEN